MVKARLNKLSPNQGSLLAQILDVKSTKNPGTQTLVNANNLFSSLALLCPEVIPFCIEISEKIPINQGCSEHEAKTYRRQMLEQPRENKLQHTGLSHKLWLC